METKTAGFWIRAVAQLIDAALICLLLFLPLGGSREKMLIGQVVSFALTYAYFYYFYISRGQTVGKMITGIQIYRVDGGPTITFKTVTLRKSFDLIFSLIRVVVFASALFRMSDAEFNQIVGRDPSTSIYNEDPILFGSMIGMVIWTFIDTIVLLAHPQKRSLHDLIAGTVVKYVQKAQVTAAIISIFFLSAHAHAGTKVVKMDDIGVRFDLKATPTPALKEDLDKPSIGRCDGKDYTDMAALESCQRTYAIWQSTLKPMMNVSEAGNLMNSHIAIPNVSVPNVALPAMSMPAVSMPAIPAFR